MTRKTNSYNAYESGLTGPLAIGATSVAVDSAAGLVAPLYLVIDPDFPLLREWVRVNTINGNTLENLVRNLEGSVGDVQHEAGAKIRSVPTKQIFDDIFQDAADDELNLTQHETDGGDPHAQAGYLKEGDADGLYVNVSGDTMAGPLNITPTPTAAANATRKDYVDTGDSDAEAAAAAYSDSLDHDHASPIAAHASDKDAHHNEVHAADGAAHTSGGEADGRALVADGSGGLKFVTPAAGVTDHGALSGLADDDHPQYITQVAADLLYLKLDGSSIMAGALNMGLQEINNVLGMTFVNAASSGSGFIELQSGAGREVIAIGAGNSSGEGNQMWFQIVGENDGVSNPQFNMRRGGTSLASFTETVIAMPPIFGNVTSGVGAANVYVDASGNLFRLTDV